MRALQIVLLVTSAALLADIIRRADLRRAGGLVLEVGPRAFLLLVPGLVGITLQAIGWRPVLVFLGREVRLVRLVVVRLVAEAVALSVPAGTVASEYAALRLLHRHAGVPVPEGLSAIAARRVLVALTNGLYVATAFALGYAHVARASAGAGGAAWLSWLMLVASAGLLGSAIVMARAAFSGAFAGWLLRALSRVPLGSARAWLGEQAPQFAETDRHLGRLAAAPRRTMAGSALAFLGVWLTEGIETLITLHLVGASLGFTEALSIEVLASLLRSFAFVLPAGLGVQDAGYVALLGAFGVPDAATIGIAFLMLKRLKELFWVVLGYGLLLLIARPGLLSQWSRRRARRGG